MTRRSHTIRQLLCATLTCCAIAGLTATTVSAAEFCVSCTQPFAIYRCAVGNSGVLTAPPGAQLPCIKELARQGGHKSCSVNRETQTECVGKLLVLSPDPATQIPNDHPLTATDDPAWIPDGEPGKDNPQTAGVPEDPKPNGEPKTVVEFADQTAKSSKKGLDNAGRAVVDAAKSTGGHIKNAGKYVGSTAKKTWDCITSLFFNCGG